MDVKIRVHRELTVASLDEIGITLSCIGSTGRKLDGMILDGKA
jgi:hypothetical protein